MQTALARIFVNRGAGTSCSVPSGGYRSHGGRLVDSGNLWNHGWLALRRTGQCRSRWRDLVMEGGGLFVMGRGMCKFNLHRADIASRRRRAMRHYVSKPGMWGKKGNFVFEI